MAARLGMSIDMCKLQTSASQFITWMEFFEWEINSFDKTDHYLAQIAAEVRRSYIDSKKSRPFSVKDFLLKFVHKEQEEAPNPAKASMQKSFFFALTGLTGGAKNKEKKGKRK